MYNSNVMRKLTKNKSQSEKQIPRMAKLATKAAYRNALASGSCVLISKDGEIRRVHPDGTSEFVKNSPPPVNIQKGIVSIKWA